MDKKRITEIAIPDICHNFDERFLSLIDNSEIPELSITDEMSESDERYELKEKIGQGGLKEVWKAFDKKSGRFVAMALLQDDSSEEAIEAFFKEARMTALLEHANIIPAYDVGYIQARPFFTMKIIHGQSFREYIADQKENHTDNLNKRLSHFLKICDALAYAHSRGIIHLDLKPENIYIDSFGEVLILDWGIAQRLFIPEGDENLLAPTTATYETIIRGTPGTMAPEQIDIKNKCVDERTDIFALGVILYNLLTFESPFDGDGVTKVLEQTLTNDIVDPSINNSQFNVPASLAAVTLKAMEEDSEERYQTVIELQEEMQRYQDGFATKAEDASFGKQLSLLIKRHKRICISLTVFTLTLFAIVIFFVIQLKTSEAYTKRTLQLLQLSQDKTMSSLKTAEKNLELYQKENEEKLEIGKVSSEILAERSVRVPFDNNIEETRRRIELAVKAAPNSEKVQRIKFLFHMVNQDFHQACETYPKIPQNKAHALLYRIATKYKEFKKDEERLSEQLFLELLADLFAYEKRWIATSLIFYHQKQDKSKESKIKRALNIQKISNRKQKMWDAKYKIGKKFDLDFLDLSGHKKLRYPDAIIGLSITELNVSNIEHLHVEELNIAKIKRIILVDTGFDVHKLLYRKHLKEVVLRKGQIKDSEQAILDYFYKIIIVD
ncbi:MAG: serine/threonine protein kinase [Lentisphaeraceae bacterium]|nr:serine/threonine protein kinase [Lentisphaeraceae bacterium]